MKKFTALTLGSIATLFAPAVAFAQQSIDPCVNNPDLTTCQTSTLQIGDALGTVIQFLFVIAVILALGFLVFGGIKWITSGGDKGGVEAARNTIIAAIVGLIVVFLAYVVLNLVLTFLTGNDIRAIKIPQLAGCSATFDDDGNATECSEGCEVSSTGKSCVRSE